jgi:hypothetical protein
LSAWRQRSCGIIAGVAATLALSACGGGQAQNVNEPRANFRVSILSARFPASQSISETSRLVISVRNTGIKTVPNVAVTICNVTCAYPAPKGEGSSAAAFSTDNTQPYLANPSRPTWIVDRPPGACRFSCTAGGQGAAVTAYANTWALGELKPGHVARFIWTVTAVSPGNRVVAWQVAAGLNGKARAVLADGSRPQGRFAVHIDQTPAQTYVNNNGQITNSG